LRTASTFGGPVSYASGIWEEVDWSGFDVVGIDGYRDEQNAPYYRQLLAPSHRHGKPVVVTEFGCCNLPRRRRPRRHWLDGRRPGRRPDDPTRDTDLASNGVVAMLDGGRRGTRYPDMRWEPKMVFDAMALRVRASGVAPVGAGYQHYGVARVNQEGRS
jgi:hypothetical protein